MTKRQLLTLLLLLCCVVGIVICYHLTTEHYLFLSGQRPGNTYCNISQLFNCDAVSLSPYSLVYGVTQSAVGFAYFLWLFFASWFLISGGGKSEIQTRTPLLLPVALLGCLGSLTFLFLSFVVLK